MTDKLDSIGWEVVVAYSRDSLEVAEYNRINPVNIAPMTTESQTTVLTCSLVILRQEERSASHLMPTHIFQIWEVKWQPEVGQRVN